ncbi:MAG: hypothetical protein IKO40_04465 [Kiritimatiellae bacterium]|nr:hypothetical protein [Kiritimatiellia bacterium]
MKRIRKIFAAVALFTAFAAVAADTARIRVVNKGRCAIELDDGTVVSPGASVMTDVPASRPGTICGEQYPAIMPNGLYTMLVGAASAGRGIPAEPPTGQPTVKAPAPRPAPADGGDPAATPALDYSMRKALLDFHMRFSDDPTNTLAKYANVPTSHAEEMLERMTCRMPSEFKGFFRDLVRRTMPWTEPLPDGQSMVCLYNPWCDGAIIFPVRQEGDSFAILACPAIVAGELFHDGLADAEAEPDGEGWTEKISSNAMLSHQGFLSMAKGGEWDVERFVLWNEDSRQQHLKVVFSRLGELMKGQAGVMLLEAEEKPGAVRYGAFLEALGKNGDASAILTPSAAKAWNDLPEAFRGSLWPVLAVPCTGGVLTAWQSMLVPETALFIEFSDEPEEEATSISFLDFE